MKIPSLMLSKKALLPLLFLITVFGCSDEQLEPQSDLNTSETLNITEGTTLEVNNCSSCTYVVPPDTKIIDGKLLGLKPGSVIGLDARIKYGMLVFRNIVGTLEQPIIIRNCGGTAYVDGTGMSHGIKTERSEYFRITGGDVKNSYGIVVTGGQLGVGLGGLSNHFEVDHLEIHNVGFAGIMAKTDPTCDSWTWRENFLMKGIALHSNYIHHSGGEGIYAGNSFFTGMTTKCGVQLPHEIHYIRIFANIVTDTGWDGIQLGCATKGASVFNNTIENYGTKGNTVQNNGIQIGSGTGGVCYNNFVNTGTGNGMMMNGIGDNVVYNNIIMNPGTNGVFCDERYTPGEGFKFINNTILNPGKDGIRIYAELVPLNTIVNNVIANPQAYHTYVYPRTPEDAFIYKLNSSVRIDLANNYFTMDSTSLGGWRMLNNGNLWFESTTPLVDQGADITRYGIEKDFNYKPRFRGSAYDIGAIEFY
jgi:hypothetical protein